ncbi:unnamed protein product [Rotaria sordida]|uniref:Uncharacterized protein n=1 Tax=Rotaria sordida TaxID=392033 RepID=A0A814N6V1_9BILA|nr:unnamed protein product [Rotaria sordida]CAF1261449.1 unnamed protein product [Rotaria sordida]CAF3498072.1 unnamed protein product [Rotaria sordida]CAF3540569.1 unnamed protein product [Rotaria sordida]
MSSKKLIPAIQTMKIIYGSHGRQNILPYHYLGMIYRTPWRFWYSNSQVFRWFSRLMCVAVAASVYLPLRGVDLTYTPYNIVHHQLDHKFGHWIEEMRYPVDQKRVEEYKKQHGLE